MQGLRRKALGIFDMTLIGLLASCGQVGPAISREYYVDFASGDDQNVGDAPNQPWRHAPGDPAASGKPRMVRLQPGDVVNFAAGVTYRGSIDISASGTPGSPIVFRSSPGERATISGAMPVQAQACSNQPECLGAPTGAMLLGLPATDGELTLFDDRGPLRLAQSPDPENDVYPDEPQDLTEIETALIADGSLPVPPGVEDCNGDCRLELALWVQSNVVIYRRIETVADGVARFDPNGIKFYLDRPTRFAWRGDVKFIDRPGEFARVSPDRIVVMPHAGASSFEVATGKGGFRLKGASGITISGLRFERMADGGRYGSGIAIFANDPGILAVTITGNEFRDFDLGAGTGVVNLRGVSDLWIKGNSIDRVLRGSGIRLAGPSQRTEIEDNRITRIGRTAIYVSDMDDVAVRRNFVADVRGVHGNGLTAYLGNHRVEFTDNTVVDAKQPATFHGAGPSRPEANDIVFARNIFISTPDSLGALISWGQQTRGVKIEGNLLLGGRFGLRMHKADTGVVVRGNRGMAPAPTAPLDNSVTGPENLWFSAQPGWVEELAESLRRGTPLDPKIQFRLCKDLAGPHGVSISMGQSLECH